LKLTLPMAHTVSKSTLSLQTSSSHSRSIFHLIFTKVTEYKFQ